MAAEVKVQKYESAFAALVTLIRDSSDAQTRMTCTSTICSFNKTQNETIK